MTNRDWKTWLVWIQYQCNSSYFEKLVSPYYIMISFFYSQNPLVKRVIDVFDGDANGEVDFKEFVLGLAEFTLNEEDDYERKLKFAFKIYDMDRDGYISNAELHEVRITFFMHWGPPPPPPPLLICSRNKIYPNCIGYRDPTYWFPIGTKFIELFGYLEG